MDTTEADKIRTEIYKKMSYTQKWEEACKLRQFAWDIKAAAIREKYPDISEEEIQKKVRDIFLYATT